MAERKTERVNVWLTHEQVAWLKTKKNLSETVRAMVTESMNLERLAQSVKNRAAKKTAGKNEKSFYGAPPTLHAKAESQLTALLTAGRRAAAEPAQTPTSRNEER